jgi:exodeoxyribonuclease V gamma subunit
MREPLPLYCRTSAAWAVASAEGKDPARAAAASWVSEFRFDKEDKEAEHVLVLGGGLAFDAMVECTGVPRAEEAAWDPTESSRFGLYARRLWGGLLEHEEIVDR